MNKKIRAFICVDFPPEVMKEIARIQEVLKTKEFRGKLIEPENLHLTLKFLGEISEEKIVEVKEKMKEVVFSEFEAVLGGVGTFDFKGAPRIVWIKINGAEILNLQKQIDNALSEMFEKERRFMSHLTIARIKYVKDISGLRGPIENLKVNPVKFRVESFKLMKSELEKSGAVYGVLEEFFQVSPATP